MKISVTSKQLAIMALIVGIVPLFFNSPYILSVFVLIGIYSLITIGLSLLMGYAGQISLGHAAFFGLGAYFSGVLTTTYQLSPWIALVIGIVVTGLLSFVIGIPILKLKEHFLAFATIGVNVILFVIFLGMASITKGAAGLSGIPKLNLLGFLLHSEISFYYFTWVVVLIITLLSLNIVNSHVGRVLRGIHDSEIATRSLGVNVGKYKLHIFVLSAVFASIAGSLYAHFMNFITPSTFHILVSIQFLVMVVVGGSQSIWGAITGAFIMTMISEGINHFLPMIMDVSGEIEIIAYGIVLILVVMFMPKGLIPTFSMLVDRFQSKGNRILIEEDEEAYGKDYIGS